ncbi:MAG: class I SAM-dependent methyltransferase, partial [Limisphaerales bacterium]
MIVDLCSGAGGPALSLAADLAAQGLFPRMILTDRFPHVCAKKPLTEADQTLSFYAEPVDARAVPDRLTGLRTCFNAFHHFRPDDAVAVLQDAARARQAIAIFENPDRRWREILGVFFLLPILVLLV